jgi:hypothetical protein
MMAPKSCTSTTSLICSLNRFPLFNPFILVNPHMYFFIESIPFSWERMFWFHYTKQMFCSRSFLFIAGQV